MTEFGYLSPMRLLSGLDRQPRVDRAAHQAIHGVIRAEGLDELVAAARKVDLRGRGGAAFPFARKVTAVASAARSRGCRTVVLVNATESEPASMKDHFLLRHTPHLILDGAMLAARALGAREAVIAVTDRGQARQSIRGAVAESRYGDVLRVVSLPERFVTGAYLGAESSGQCGPCRLGLPALARSLGLLASGERGPEALPAVRHGVETIPGRGACNHPDGAIRFVRSALTAFADDVETHLAHGTCGRPVPGLMPIARARPAVSEDETSNLRLEVDWTRCAAHGLCGHLAPGLVRLDENGYPMIADTDIPHRLVPDAQEAVEKCPALALRLSESD